MTLTLLRSVRSLGVSAGLASDGLLPEVRVIGSRVFRWMFMTSTYRRMNLGHGWLTRPWLTWLCSG